MSDEPSPRSIRFRVSGALPPKKDGANSMWRKPVEVERLLVLRRAAFAALNGRRLEGAALRLVIEVRCPEPTCRTTGDLDNFVTGVCDGLQRSDARTPWRDIDIWTRSENAPVAPDVFEVFPDDARIVEIVARKAAAAAPSYDVEISEIGAP